MISLKLNYQNNISKINFWALLLFIFWLPLKDDYLPIILALWIFTWLLEGNFKSRLLKLPQKQLFYSLSFYFILTVLAIFHSSDFEYGFFQIQEKLSMIFFPLFLLGSNEKVKKNYKIIFYTFILGNLVAVLYCLGYTFFTNLIFENNSFFIKYWTYDGFKEVPFWQLINMRYNIFSYSYLSIFKHPSYFTVYLLFCILILVYSIREKLISKSWTKLAAYFLILAFSFFIYLLQSRAGIISMALIFIFIPIIEIQKRLKKRYLAILITTFAIFGIIIITNSRIKNNFAELKELFVSPSNFSLQTSDSRYQLWYTSIQVIKENFWFGTSPANLTDKLVLKYDELGFKLSADGKLNSHNQYLETFAGLGVFGFLSLMFILIYSFVISIKKHNYLLFFLILILSFNFLFESMMNRMAGILFMMFFMSLLGFANIREFEGKKT